MKMYWPVTKGCKVLVSTVRGLLAGPPFTDRVQRKKGSEKTLGGPEAGSNGGGCGGVPGQTQETLRDQTGTPGGSGMTLAARGVGGSLFKGKMRPTMWGHSRVSEELTTEDTTCQAGAQQTRAQNTQAGPAGRGPGGGPGSPPDGPTRPGNCPRTLSLKAKGRGVGEGLGIIFSANPPPDSASPGRVKQAGTPVRNQHWGLQLLLQECCGGALGRGHPLRKETPEEQHSTGGGGLGGPQP